MECVETGVRISSQADRLSWLDRFAYDGIGEVISCESSNSERTQVECSQCGKAVENARWIGIIHFCA